MWLPTWPFFTVLTTAFAPHRQIGAKSSRLTLKLKECEFVLPEFDPLVQNEAIEGDTILLVRNLGFTILGDEKENKVGNMF